MADQEIMEYGAPPFDPAGNRPVEAKQPEPEVLVPRTHETTEDKELQKKERERRRYIKRKGGFRKDLRDVDIALGQKLCDELGAPPESGWLPIHIPGYDNANHAANEPKPDAVEAMTSAVDRLTNVKTSKGMPTTAANLDEVPHTNTQQRSVRDVTTHPPAAAEPPKEEVIGYEVDIPLPTIVPATEPPKKRRGRPRKADAPASFPSAPKQE